MKFEAITIKDIAKALGLSTSTISRALRDSYEISAETKEQVLNYAKKNNYHPNPIALSLREKKSSSIGVVIAEIANSFFSQVIHGIEVTAHQYGYNVIIAQTLESYEQEVNTMQLLASRSVDGCLVSVAAETNNYAHFSNLYSKGFPIVFFDRIVEEINTHQVMADTFGGAYDATMHLLQNGYNRIAVLAGAYNVSVTKQRLAGYAKALQDFGLPVNEMLIKYCPNGGRLYSEVESAIDYLLSEHDKPDAVFALADKLTTGCVQYCKAHDIHIPGELGLTGFSNLDLTDLLSPSLTVVRQPAFEMGKKAAELLIKMIESKRPVTAFESPLLPTELLIRESSSIKEEVFMIKQVKQFA